MAERPLPAASWEFLPPPSPADYPEAAAGASAAPSGDASGEDPLPADPSADALREDPLCADPSADAPGEEPLLADPSEEAPREKLFAPIPPLPLDPDLAALRALILNREIVLLDQLRERLDNPLSRARDVSEVVAEALLMRAGKDDRLGRSLEPVVETLFKTALRKNPVDFASAFFPLMGPAIRRSIAETFRGMLESFNKSMETAFSWKGLRWRTEALRTGKSFSEIVLLHTLIYRVEQIFLIHKETGLVLAHEVNEGVDSEDADMVSAMLTAIQDFARDCFAGGREGELESLQLGDFTILLEKGPYAYMACVVRGTPPAGFRQDMRTSLELILLECADALTHFDGDTAPFLFARRHLKECLVSRFVDEGKPLPFWAKALPALLVLALVGAFGFWLYAEHTAKLAAEAAALVREQERSLFRRTMLGRVDALRAEPGLLVLECLESDSLPWAVTCLRDPNAREPSEVLRQAGSESGDFTLTVFPYMSLQPDMVSLRVREKIHPPESVRVELNDNGILRLSGSATLGWILRARQDALLIPGINGVDVSGVRDPDMAKLQELVGKVESAVVRFPMGKDTPIPEDAPALAEAVNTLVEIENMARNMGMSIGLTVYGHADVIGSEKRNYELSQSRARTLAAMLYARGSSLPVTMYGMGAEYAKDSSSLQGNLESRRIELRVRMERSTPPGEELVAR